jgi:hypothetical protein
MAGGKYLMLGREYEPGFAGEVVPQTHPEIFEQFEIEVRIL